MNREEDIDLVQHRLDAIERAKVFLADKPVDVGSIEYGYMELYDLKEREVVVFFGDDAGVGSNQDFHYKIKRPADRWAILVWAHTHPKVIETGLLKRLNRRNRRPSPVDNRNLIPYGPLVLKGPDGGIRVFNRRGKKPFRDHPAAR